MLQTEPRRGAAEGRECTVCPPWVLRCAHWDGKVLALALSTEDTNHIAPCGPMTCLKIHVNTAVGYGPCESCGVPDRLHGITDFTCHDDLPAAEAEFRRREATLLGRAE